MKIETFLEKAEARELNLIRHLILLGREATAAEMIEFLEITKASLDKDIEMIQSRFEGAELAAEITYDGQSMALTLSPECSFEQIQQLYLADSVKVDIINYLYRHQEFSVIQLAQKLSLSESSLFRKIKELNDHLSEFNIKIRNGRFHGEELQIRYFYYQFYWNIADKSTITIDTQDNQVSSMTQGIEKFLEVSFDSDAKERIGVWFDISKQRIKVKKKKYAEMRKQMAPYLDDHFYQKIRQMLLRYFSRYSLEFDEEEAMMHFIFLMAFPVLSEEDFHQYRLLRGRRTPSAYLDTYIVESIVIQYQVKRLPFMLERILFYSLSQIHTKLYFLQGDIENYDYDALLKKVRGFTGNELVTFATQLCGISLGKFALEDTSETSLNRLMLIKYISLLDYFTHTTQLTLRVGIDLHMDPIYTEMLNRMLILKMRHMNGTQVERYDATKTYDLILTNESRRNHEKYRTAQVYVLSEVLSEFDLHEIEALIKRINQ